LDPIIFEVQTGSSNLVVILWHCASLVVITYSN